MIGALHDGFPSCSSPRFRAISASLAALLCMIFTQFAAAQGTETGYYTGVWALSLEVKPDWNAYYDGAYTYFPGPGGNLVEGTLSITAEIAVADPSVVLQFPEMSNAPPSHIRLYLIPECELVLAGWYDPDSWEWTTSEVAIPAKTKTPTDYFDEGDPYIVWSMDWPNALAIDPSLWDLQPDRVVPALEDRSLWRATWNLTPEESSMNVTDWYYWPPDQFDNLPWWYWMQDEGVYYPMVVVDMQEEVPEHTPPDDTLNTNTYFWRQPIYFWPITDPSISVSRRTYHIPPPTPTPRPSPSPTPTATPAEEAEAGQALAPGDAFAPGDVLAPGAESPLPYSLAQDLAFEDQGPDWRAKAKAALDRPRHPKEELWRDYIVVRFRRERAARAHAERLAGPALREALWTKRSQSDLLASLPSEFIGLHPFVSGSRKATDAAGEKPAISGVLAANGELDSAQIALATRAIAEAAEPHGPLGLFHVKLAPGADPYEASYKMIEHPDVVYAHPARVCRPMGVPNDPLYPRQWAPEMIKLPQAWDLVRNDYLGPQPGSSLRVCVVDTGVRVTHADLAGRIADPVDVYPWNGDAYANSDPEDDDPHGHGTAVAGIIAAIRDNQTLMAGSAPVTIIPVNASYYDPEDPETVGFLNYEDGVFWGVDRGASVINMSLGGSGSPTGSEEDAAAYAKQKDVVVCVASGNDGEPPAWVKDPDPGGRLLFGFADWSSPAGIESYVTVGAVDQTGWLVTSGRWFWGSQYGNVLDICAPGQGGKWVTLPWAKESEAMSVYEEVTGAQPSVLGDSIVSLARDHDTAITPLFNGTSAASPEVAGVAALVRLANPTLTANEVTTVLLLTAHDRTGDPREDYTGWDMFHGYGVVDAYRAVAAARGRVEFFDIANSGTLPLKIYDIRADEAPWLSFYPQPPFHVPMWGREKVMAIKSPDFGPAIPTTVTIQVYSNDRGIYWDARKRRHVPKSPISVAMPAGPYRYDPDLDKKIEQLIKHFYNNVLQRDPFDHEIAGWKTHFYYSLGHFIDVIFIPKAMGITFFFSAEYEAYEEVEPMSVSPGKGGLRGVLRRPDDNFIRDCYRTFLQREPFQNELSQWLAGQWSRYEVVSIFAESEEFEDFIRGLFPDRQGLPARNFVAASYYGVLDRLVDRGGLLGATPEIEAAPANQKREVAKLQVRSLLMSAEFLNWQPRNEDRVIRLYRAFLSRFASDGEVAYWAGLLNTGAMTQDQMLDIFAASPEFTAKLVKYFGPGSY